jgi:hypothetical protein
MIDAAKYRDSCRICRFVRHPYPYWECWGGQQPRPTYPDHLCRQYEREPGADDDLVRQGAPA